MLRLIQQTPQTSRWISGSLLGALAALAPACSNDDDWRFGDEGRPRTNINVVYDPAIDFSEYQTFALRNDAENADPLDELDPATQRDVELANALVARELSDLGLIEVSADEADLLAFSLGRTSSATGVQWSCIGGVWGGYWYWDYLYYDPCAWVEADYVELTRTTLVVGLLDPELSEVAFAGFARDIAEGPGRRRQDIVRAIEAIFDRYPARPQPRPGTDAGVPDVDAALPEVDAGTPAVDAGSPDAGDGGAGDAGTDAALADSP